MYSIENLFSINMEVLMGNSTPAGVVAKSSAIFIHYVLFMTCNHASSISRSPPITKLCAKCRQRSAIGKRKKTTGFAIFRLCPPTTLHGSESRALKTRKIYHNNNDITNGKANILNKIYVYLHIFKKIYIFAANFFNN